MNSSFQCSCFTLLVSFGRGGRDSPVTAAADRLPGKLPTELFTVYHEIKELLSKADVVPDTFGHHRGVLGCAVSFTVQQVMEPFGPQGRQKQDPYVIMLQTQQPAGFFLGHELFSPIPVLQRHQPAGNTAHSSAGRQLGSFTETTDKPVSSQVRDGFALVEVV